MFARTETAPIETVREAPLYAGHALANLIAFDRDPLRMFMQVQAECGDIARVRFPSVMAMELSDPEHVQHVLLGNAANYAKKTRGYRTLRLVLGDGLVTSEGEHWRRQRRIAQPAFHKDRIAGFAERMAAAALDTADGWRRQAGPVDVAAEMYRTTLRVAGETLFSQDISRDSDAVGEALGIVIEHFRTLVTLPVPWPEYLPTLGNLRFWRARRSLDRVVRDIIAQRRRSGVEAPDLLGMFMSARDEETGEGMTDGQLRDEVVTMLTAGHETTANALAWTLYLLSQNRDAAARLEAEVDAVLGDRLPTVADLRALPYTQQVIKESMRLYPPVWALARLAMADDVIGGYRVPAGTFVFMCQHVIHRHPALWSDPERFDPDRFAPGREPPGRFAYFPFSRGQRMCIGDRFAEMEAAIILPVLVRRFRFELVAGHPVVPEPSITLRPRHGIRMHLRLRA